MSAAKEKKPDRLWKWIKILFITYLVITVFRNFFMHTEEEKISRKASNTPTPAVIADAEQAKLVTLPRAGPEQFATVKEILEDIGIYNTGDNTLEIISEKPLHIRVSPLVLGSDSPRVIEEEMNRAIIYSAYRAFLHTDVEQIKITALPLKRTFKPDARKLLSKPEYELTITRTNATEIAQQQLKIKNLNNLLKEEDAWADVFMGAVYKEHEPGLYRFSDALGIKLIQSRK